MPAASTTSIRGCEDSGSTPCRAACSYIGVLLLGYLLASAPFDIYATFVIEERFGFNRTSPRTYVLDRVKGLALLVVLGGPLLAGILAFFEYAGGLAWLYCWAAVTLFNLGLQFLAPTWIMPIFNRFTPMEPGELRDAILSYARNVDFGVDNVLVMDGSKRSSKSNAFFTGFGRNKRIALFDTLVEAHTVPELVAVLAHEIGHYKRAHILQRISIGIVHSRGDILFCCRSFSRARASMRPSIWKRFRHTRACFSSGFCINRSSWCCRQLCR